MTHNSRSIKDRNKTTEELFQEDPYLQGCDAVVETVDAERRCFTVNRTVFYPMGGGQPGDSGSAFYKNDVEFGISDTRRDPDSGEIQHFVEDCVPMPVVGDGIYLEIDWERRYLHMRMHSCLHLLCAVVPGKVTGGQIHEGRGRLDFDIKMPNDKEQLTQNLNLLIQHNADRISEEYTAQDLEASPDLAEFLTANSTKNSENIKMVRFDGIDIQPCGGTHVANTQEIGSARVEKIENKGRHNRRIHVVLVD